MWDDGREDPEFRNWSVLEKDCEGKKLLDYVFSLEDCVASQHYACSIGVGEQSIFVLLSLCGNV